MLIADHKHPLAYALADDKLSAYTLVAEPRLIGSRAAKAPPWVKTLQGDWPGGDMRIDDKYYRGNPCTPVAVTQGDSLYLFLLDSKWRTIHRGQTSVFEAPPTAVVRDQFETVPTPDVVTAFAFTPDGRQMVAAHQQSGQLTVWDTLSGELLRQVEIDSPSALLIRGDRAYVAKQVVRYLSSRPRVALVGGLCCGRT